MVVEFQPLLHHPLDVHPDWGEEGEVNHVFVPPPHLYPRLFDKRWVGCKEGINSSSCILRPALEISLEDLLDLAAKDLHRSLYLSLLRRDSLVDEAPGIWRYPRLAEEFPPLSLGYRPEDFNKQVIFGASIMWQSKEEAAPNPNAAHMLSRRCPPDTYHHKVIIRIVLHIPDQHVLVQTLLRPQ